MAFEVLVLGYLAFFAVAAPFTAVARARRVRVALTALALAVALLTAMRKLGVDVRLWLPLLYLPLGYWLPAPLVALQDGTPFEAWLQRTDEMMRLARLPSWIESVVELGYLCCYPLVPLALAIVWLKGSRSDVAGFWLAVVTAGYACYATLPWLVSRPPRRLERRRENPAGVAQVNLVVLDSLSHDLVTFPSAHVAVAVAAAIVVARVWLPGGIAMTLMAMAVAAGAVTGRYHFTVDVVLGAVVGILAAQV